MKDEIKEIDELLNTLKTSSLEPHEEYTMEFSNKEQKLLLDYITNLQEENQRLKENKLTPDELANLLNQELIKQRDDYKSRCEKAIEYIHNHQPVFELSNKEQTQEWFEKEYYIELLNILNGGYEER